MAAASAAVGHAAPSFGFAASETYQNDKRIAEEKLMADMVRKLADGLARTLVEVFQDLRGHVIVESQKVSHALRQQLEKLETAIQSLDHLTEKFDYLNDAVARQKAIGIANQECCAQLGESVAALTAARDQGREVTSSMAGEVSALSTKLTAQQDELATL